MNYGKSNQDIERLKAQRKGYRGVVNRQIDVANQLVSNFSEISDNTSRLRTIATSLKDKRGILDDCNKQIMQLVDVEQIEGEIEESDDIDQNIANTIELIKWYFEQQLHYPAQTTQLQTSNSLQFNFSQFNNSDQNIDSSEEKSDGSSSTCGQDNNYSSHDYTELPRISLPKFSGDFKKYTEFWDIFNSLVHTNDQLSDVDKFNYLKGALEPYSRAACAIEGLTITNYNYHSACELLKEQFNTTQRIITATMDDLLKLPTVADTDGTLELRHLYVTLCVIVKGLDLEALDITSKGLGCFFLPVIMTKLPDDVRVQLEQITSKDVWEFPEILAAIKTEIQAREMSEVETQWSTVASKSTNKKSIPTSTPFVRDTTVTTPRQRHCKTEVQAREMSEVETQWSTVASKFIDKKSIPATAPFVKDTTPPQGHCKTEVQASEMSEVKTPWSTVALKQGHCKTQCVYCKSNHKSESCDQVQDFATRKKICIRNNCCFLCLEKDHSATECKSSKRCRKCKGKHHKSLCCVLNSTSWVPRCVYCKAQHFSSSCTQVKDVATRKQICNRDQRCYLCFKKGHQASKCESSNRCSACGGKHQQSLCDVVKDTPKRQSKTKCVYCKSNHNSEACDQVEDFATRKDFCRRNDRCYICLEKGHLATKCKSSKRCSKCNREHHTSLCDAVKDAPKGQCKTLCVYCKANHLSASCTQVKDVATRIQILKEANRCALCLQVGHQVSKCESSKRCKRCNRKHHKSLCNLN